MQSKVRLGRIEYLNVLPVYYALESLWGENGFKLTRGTPAELNARLRQGELEVSSISSLEFARFPENYLLLPGLSISSRGPAGSVLLFSKVPFPQLAGEVVRVSSASASGAALLRVLLTRLFGVQPDYQPGPVTRGTAGDITALLAIGDEALRLKAAGGMLYQLDLGAAWQKLTGLPFVFGVWAVRRDFAGPRPDAAVRLHRLLLRSRAWGLSALPFLSRVAAERINLPSSQVLNYFRQLDYTLGPAHEQGLTTFLQYLTDLGELQEMPSLTYFEG
jgi:chorismate dehydratase